MQEINKSLQSQEDLSIFQNNQNQQNSQWQYPQQQPSIIEQIKQQNNQKVVFNNSTSRYEKIVVYEYINQWKDISNNIKLDKKQYKNVLRNIKFSMMYKGVKITLVLHQKLQNKDLKVRQNQMNLFGYVDLNINWRGILDEQNNEELVKIRKVMRQNNSFEYNNIYFMRLPCWGQEGYRKKYNEYYYKGLVSLSKYNSKLEKREKINIIVNFYERFNRQDIGQIIVCAIKKFIDLKPKTINIQINLCQVSHFLIFKLILTKYLKNQST